MTTPTEQPEALILADKLEREARISPRIFVADERKEAAAELRRLHKENEALRADRDSWIEQASDRVKDCCDILAAREADREAMRMALETLKEAKFVLDFATAAMLVPADADGQVVQIPAAIKALEQRVGES